MIEQPASRHESAEASDSDLAKELDQWPVSSTASLGSNGYYGQVRLQGLRIDEYKGGHGQMISVGRCDALTGRDRCSSRSQSLSNLYTVFQLEPLFVDTANQGDIIKRCGPGGFFDPDGESSIVSEVQSSHSTNLAANVAFPKPSATIGHTFGSTTTFTRKSACTAGARVSKSLVTVLFPATSQLSRQHQTTLPFRFAFDARGCNGIIGFRLTVTQLFAKRGLGYFKAAYQHQVSLCLFLKAPLYALRLSASASPPDPSDPVQHSVYPAMTTTSGPALGASWAIMSTGIARARRHVPPVRMKADPRVGDRPFSIMHLFHRMKYIRLWIPSEDRIRRTQAIAAHRKQATMDKKARAELRKQKRQKKREVKVQKEQVKRENKEQQGCGDNSIQPEVQCPPLTDMQSYATRSDEHGSILCRKLLRRDFEIPCVMFTGE